MRPHPKPDFTHPFCVQTEINRIVAHQKKRGIPKPTDKNLIIATWNITNFGLQEREDNHIKLMAKIIEPFDIVAVQEVADNLDHMNKHFKSESFALEGAITDRGEVAVLTWFPDDERKKISFLMGWYRSLDVINLGLKHGGRAYSIGMWNVAHSRSYFGQKTYKDMARLKKKTDPKGIMNPNKVFSGSLQLSLRLNLLIMLIAAIAAPIVLWLAGFIVPDILNAYVPWLMVNDLSSIIIASILGLIVGTAIVEVANLIPISFVLTIGGPFMRIGRKIFH